MSVSRKSVTLQDENIEYVEMLGRLQNIKSFSKVLDNLIEEVKLNEKFDSCQNKF